MCVGRVFEVKLYSSPVLAGIVPEPAPVQNMTPALIGTPLYFGPGCSLTPGQGVLNTQAHRHPPQYK